MDKDASQAAVSAIAALQKRLKELEEERELLTDQVNKLKDHVTVNDSDYTRREKEVSEITARANKMIEDSAETLVQIKEERRQNSLLKQEILNTQKELSGLNHSCLDRLKVCSSRKKQISSYDQVLKEYESLLGLIFEPPQLIGRQHTISMKKSDYDIDLLPANQRRIARQLQELPASYTKQNLVTKRTIIQGLICTREEVNKLADKIYRLEKMRCTTTTPRSITFDINKSIQQFMILSNGMKRFKFN